MKERIKSMLEVNKIIPAEDIRLMNIWVSEYAGGNDKGERLPFEEVLSKEWAYSKENLYNVFGKNLILSKEIEFSIPKDQLEDDFDIELGRGDMKEFWDWVWWKRNSYSWGSKEFDYWSDIVDLFSCDALIDNLYDGETFKIANPKSPDKKIVISHGMKAIKALGKIAEAYDQKESFEKFRLAHSRVMNQAKLKGELCISIHPMDYMTMSDNASDWESCMSWRDYGCYRRGTVEMMNSRYVVVAYLKSSDDMKVPAGYWNNKKWRALIVMTPEIITSIKGYPYQSNELAGAAVSWLAELSNKNCGTDYDVSTLLPTTFAGGFLTASREMLYPIGMMTEDMYNDFGTLDRNHMCLASAEYAARADKSYKIFKYSGATQCVWCGQVKGDIDFGEEELLVCDDCGGYQTVYCPWCDSRLSPDEELITVDGEIMCSYCAGEEAAADPLDGELHHCDNMKCVYLIDNKFESDNSWKYNYFYTLPENLKGLTYYKGVDEYGQEVYYCKFDEIKANLKLLNAFGLYSESAIQSYKDNLKD